MDFSEWHNRIRSRTPVNRCNTRSNNHQGSSGSKHRSTVSNNHHSKVLRGLAWARISNKALHKASTRNSHSSNCSNNGPPDKRDRLLCNSSNKPSIKYVIIICKID